MIAERIKCGSIVNRSAFRGFPGQVIQARSAYGRSHRKGNRDEATYSPFSVPPHVHLFPNISIGSGCCQSGTGCCPYLVAGTGKCTHTTFTRLPMIFYVGIDLFFVDGLEFYSSCRLVVSLRRHKPTSDGSLERSHAASLDTGFLVW